MRVEPGMILVLEEPSSYGWHDPDPWTYLVLELYDEAGHRRARLLCVGSLDEGQLGKVSFEDLTALEKELSLHRKMGPMWRLL